MAIMPWAFFAPGVTRSRFEGTPALLVASSLEAALGEEEGEAGGGEDMVGTRKVPVIQ